MQRYKPLTKEQMAQRAAKDLHEGNVVNLGVGTPTLVSQYIGNKEIVLHSENGILGVGALATEDNKDRDLVNASQQFITVQPGASYFDCAESFIMLRGGHVDVALLGAYQVACNGDLANWNLNLPDNIPAVGGAMDIAVGVKDIRVLMQHCDKFGNPRLLSHCTLPLTAPGVVKRIYTDLAVLDITQQGFLVREKVKGLEFEELARMTGAPIFASSDWEPLESLEVEEAI